MKTTLLSLFSVLVLISCNNKEKAAPPPQKLKVIELKAQDVPLYREFVGQIYGHRDIPIRARVDGFLEEIHFQEGREVKKGQLLYTIDPDPFMQDVQAAQSMVAQAKTLLSQKESDYQRIKPLAEIDAVSKRELDMALASRDAARSEVQAEEANLRLSKINLSYTKLYSPIDGLIGKTLAREGEYVGKDPNPVILNTVSQIDEVRVQFFLSENEFISVSRQYAASKNDSIKLSEENDTVPVELILSDDSEYEHKGKIDFIDRGVDPNTGSILLQATFPNPQQIVRPGQFARVKVNISEAEGAILVPQRCVLELQGKYSVMKVDADNKIAAQQIEIGQTIGDQWLVTSGLKAGDKILFEGVQKVRTGVQIVPELTEFKSQSK